VQVVSTQGGVGTRLQICLATLVRCGVPVQWSVSRPGHRLNADKGSDPGFNGTVGRDFARIVKECGAS